MSTHSKPLAQTVTGTPADALEEKGDFGWIPPALIVLTIVATFWVVCTHNFTNWDDALNITNNRHLNPPTADSLVFFWLHSYAHEYIPLSYSIWWVLAQFRLNAPDAQGNVLNPHLFHAVNLLLHIGTSLIVFRLLRLLTGRPWAACAGALLFALHPLQVEPVAWITGLKDLLCGFLSMAALWEYVLFARTDPNQPVADHARVSSFRITRRQQHYLLAVVAFVAAVLAKPSAMTVPLLALAIDCLVLQRRWGQIAVSLSPLCVISAGFAIVAIHAEGAGVANPGPLWSRLFVAGDALAFYLSKLLLPVGLAALYPHSLDKVLASRMFWIAWLVPAALAVVAWLLRRRAPWFAAAVCIFIVALLPVLGLVPFEYERYSTVADRYVYVAMLGPSLALAFGLARLEAVRSAAAWRWAAPICAAGIASLAVVSAAQARYWHDTRSLFQRVLAVDPQNDVAYTDLATDALSHGNLHDAERYAQRAVDIAPNTISNRITLGTILLRLGKNDAAAAQFFKVYRLDPRNVVALTNLAGDLERRGRINDAITICRGALDIDPEFPDAHRALAIMLSKANKNAEALKEAAEAVRLEPAQAANHVVYGHLLQVSGREREAQEQFAEARALDPKSVGP